MGENYKLTYFNVTGLGEPIRLLLSHGEASWEDERIEGKDWPELKPNTPWGQMPILTINGERKIAQSSAISRYLARKFGLMPSDDFQIAMCDEYNDAFTDLRQEWRKFFMEKDTDKKADLKKAFIEEHVPKYFVKFEKIISDNGGKWMIGDQLTWVDLQFAHYIDFFERTTDPVLMEKYPNLKQVKENVFALPKVAEYISKRPKTDL